MSGSHLSNPEPSSLRHGNPDTAAPPNRPPARRGSLPLGLYPWFFSKLAAVALFFFHFKLTAVFVYLVPDAWLFLEIVTPSARGFGPTHSRFRTHEREVWLTIDDGPDPATTPRLLEVLEKAGARATFFVIGEQVDRFPALAAEISRRGHELANHTQTHPAMNLWRMGPRKTALEIDLCQSAIGRAGGQTPTRFRSPVGIKNVFLHRELKTRGLDLIAWSARGFDCISSADTSVRRIVRKIRPGAIVLLHEGNNDVSRLQVIERVLDYLSENNFTTVIPKRETLDSFGAPKSAGSEATERSFNFPPH